MRKRFVMTVLVEERFHQKSIRFSESVWSCFLSLLCHAVFFTLKRFFLLKVSCLRNTFFHSLSCLPEMDMSARKTAVRRFCRREQEIVSYTSIFYFTERLEYLLVCILILGNIFLS